MAMVAMARPFFMLVMVAPMSSPELWASSTVSINAHLHR